MQRRTFIFAVSSSVAAAGLLGWPSIQAQVDSEPQRTAVLTSVAALFASVESLDAPGFRALLSPGMMGQAQVREALALLLASEQQIRYQLSETTIAASNNTFVVRTRWERRFLLPGNAQPQLRAGAAVLAFEWVEESWRLASIGGDNPFDHGQRR